MTTFFIILGIVPSLVWLSIYLNEDDHPEPKYFILKVFFLGAVIAPVAAGVEYLFASYLKDVSLPPLITNVAALFIVIGLVEEYAKYFVVKVGIEENKAFDEPTDAMIYLIVAALGFAAVENVLALFNFANVASEAFEIILLRFLSATLLHVLASAIVGYYLARKHFFLRKNQIAFGILVAAFLHGLYNVLTVSSQGFSKLSVTIYIILLLGIMAVWVNFLFWKLKKDFFK